MINYFKNKDFQSNTAFYRDAVKSLQNNPKQLKEISRQFAEISHPSYQRLIYQLSMIKDLDFNVHGLIVTVTKFSVNYRHQLSAIKVNDYFKRWNDEKLQWSFIPRDKYRLSLDIASKQLESIEGITFNRSGSWIWISGNTFKVKDRIAKSVRGTFLNVGFKRATKQWYICPKIG